MTKISWVVNQDGTQGEVWNPVVGCSAACPYCYARELHEKRRLAWQNGWITAPAQYRVPFGEVQMLTERLIIPAKKRKPTTFFVNSVSDIFDPAVTESFLVDIYAEMIKNKRHTFLILTKQAERMAEFLSPTACFSEPKFDNIYHGVTVENQQAADERIPHLLQVPGNLFVSYEPALGRVIFKPEWLSRIVCVIIGGKSGGTDRYPLNFDWARSVRNQCDAINSKFFFKQDSGPRPNKMPLLDGVRHDSLPWGKP